MGANSHHLLTVYRGPPRHLGRATDQQLGRLVHGSLPVRLLRQSFSHHGEEQACETCTLSSGCHKSSVSGFRPGVCPREWTSIQAWICSRQSSRLISGGSVLYCCGTQSRTRSGFTAKQSDKCMEERGPQAHSGGSMLAGTVPVTEAQ